MVDNERQLILEAQKNPKAFSKIYEIYYKKIFNYLLRRTAHIELAQDLTSEVFFKAYQNLWQFRFRKISFSAWIYRIATNHLIDFFRKHKYSALSLEKLSEEKGYEPAHYQTPKHELIVLEEELKKHTDFLTIQKLILNLSFDEQTIITLKFFEKKKINEIAEITGKKPGTIKSILSRSMEKLRKLALNV